MCLYTLPIIILNLGGEMFYVLDQRLRAQNIPQIRGQKGIMYTYVKNKYFNNRYIRRFIIMISCSSSQ